MFARSVASITKSLTKMIDQLDTHAQASEARYKEHVRQMQVEFDEQIVAQSISRKLKDLLSMDTKEHFNHA